MSPPPKTASLPTSPAATSRRGKVVPRMRRRDAAELLDEAGHDPAELAGNLADIRRVNRLAGGTWATMRELPRLLAAVPADREATVLDLATGSGDLPLAVIRWATRRKRPLRVIASDLSEEILAEAGRRLAGCPEASLARYDARAVPLPDGAVDVVLCSLALHHFPPDDAIATLREMDRLGRHGFVLNDIRRGAVGYGVAWAASRLATRNRLTRHDMPLSVLRAYTPDEVRSLLAQAGIDGAVVRTSPLFRMTAVQGPNPARSGGRAADGGTGRAKPSGNAGLRERTGR